jgi:hypothetical protein
LDDGGLACGWEVDGGFDELLEFLPSFASNSATRTVKRWICSVCHWMKAATAGGSAAKTSGGSDAGASMRTATIPETECSDYTSV